MDEIKLDYVEFPSADIEASQSFFAKAFGWEFVDYGPHYRAFANAGMEGGIDGSPDRVKSPLIIAKTFDLEAAQARVKAAGGEITIPIFTFPGGRRFHFCAPGGIEMALWSEDAKE